MIAGLGTDLVEVVRISAAMNKSDQFREMIFSAEEINYCESKTNKFEHYAARFAAKEAFFKALGTGWLTGTTFKEVEVINNGDGKPEIFLSGQTAETLAPMRITNIMVSLSHVKTMAQAVVIIEK
ncbi:holo-ACP synthase [Mucilaginibacter agri]|uniref:Holo-[acyl-carrier-protein] synthase n=1 Tax=Mucilaginibacter agri TaxID=2695265 RepID=A0A966DTQ7_9SPHI|nr:holo-ACP synthase [Mucilaginibacter agri]NCD70915.1 holo-[acyl-carrier-protein] synthase [Mucilaginibacter agri]